MTADEFIKQFGVKCLFHFTDLRNLPSIAEHGLLRLAELRSRAVSVAAPGGNRWSHDADTRLGLDKYVHLCLFNQHPMEWTARKEGHVQETAFLQIDPAVLNADGVRFAPGVANKTGVPLLTLDEAIEQMDFAVVYTRTDWKDPAVQKRLLAARKYEVLVPADIPVNMIRGL
jgi:hypothetical protein